MTLDLFAPENNVVDNGFEILLEYLEEIGRHVLTVSIPGEPVGAARPRVVQVNGRARAYEPKVSASWKKKAVRIVGHYWRGEAIDDPVMVVIESIHPRPKSLIPRRLGGTLSAPAEGRLADQYGDDIPHHRKPDVDNVTKLALDALTKAGVVYDDGRVSTCLHRKRYARLGEKPSVLVRVFRW